MRENKDKISPETSEGKFFFFYPVTGEEAQLLVSKLRDAGFKMREKSSTAMSPENMVTHGVGVINGEYFCNPNKGWNGAPLGNWLCTIEQIDSDYLPPDQRRMVDLFNKLTARIDELAEKINRIEQQVCPQEMDKKPRAKGLNPGGKP